MTTTRRDPIASSSSSSSSPPPDLYENKATKPAEHGKSASVPNLDDRDEKPDAVEPQGTLPTPPVRRKIQITDSNESRNPDNILDVDDDYGIHYKSQSTIRFVIDANKSVLELLEGECRRAANTLDVDDEHGLYYKAQSSMRCAVEANKSLLRLLEGDCRRTAETHDANSIRSRVVDNQPLTTRLDWLVATTNPTEHLKIGCQSNLNTYRLVGWLWGCLVGWWGSGVTG